MKKDYKIFGMHCASCAKLIETTLRDIDGVSFVECDFDKGVLSVESNLTSERLSSEVVSLGYTMTGES